MAFARFGVEITIIAKHSNILHMIDQEAVKILKQEMKRLNIKIGIITTPANAAKQVSQLMVESDIKAIWNFAQTHLNVDEAIVVEDVNLTASFSVLSNKLKEKLARKG